MRNSQQSGDVLSRSMRTVLWIAIILMGGQAETEAAPPTDTVTGFPREVPALKEWKPGKKVAICFVFDVEVWGLGKGPYFRPDTATRSPDLVNEAFRQYGIDFGVERVGKVFQDEDVPLTTVLNALFPVQQPEVWKRFRSLAPQSPIVAHGMNNSTDQLPFDHGLKGQEVYIKRTLDVIEKATGVRPKGWSSPSVYANVDTFRACAAEGITYTLDAMDSDNLSILKTPDGDLQMLPYPTVTVDMGQFLVRNYKPADMERLWIDYVGQLALEADKNPEGNATVVTIGIHPFVMGTPDGAAALRRTLEALKKLPNVWLTDVDTVSQAAKAQAK